MIKGVEKTSRETIGLIIKIKDLLNNLFKHPYTKIECVVNDLGVSRLTAVNYLNKLADDKMLRAEYLGTGNYYINEELYELLTKR